MKKDNLKFKNKSEKYLLKIYSNIIKELRAINILRTSNNPVADYAEWLVVNKLGFQLVRNSNTGYDAIGKRIKYQIKSRRLTEANQSRQLGVIRNLNRKHFDYLLGILFDEYFNVAEAYLIPQNIIYKYSRFSKHQNGYILQLRGEILKNKKVKNILNQFT